jgi:hypothetical protein
LLNFLGELIHFSESVSTTVVWHFDELFVASATTKTNALSGTLLEVKRGADGVASYL